MYSDMIGKIEKARQYAQQPERISITSLRSNFRSSNGLHSIVLKEGHWDCDCESFRHSGTCQHIMALQKVLDLMLTPDARALDVPMGVHMHSEMISKIEKARHYAHEPERIEILALTARFHGSNDDHEFSLQEGRWECDCSFFSNWGTCPHVMAAQKILECMLTPVARQPELGVTLNNGTVSL